MYKDKKSIKRLIVILLLVSLLISQAVYAEEVNVPTDTDTKTSYKTYEVELGDYMEKSGIKNVAVNFLRMDSLTINDPQGTFVKYLVANNQPVKKGDPLVSYRIPYDSIRLEEMKLSLSRNEKSYQETSKQKETAIAESLEQLHTLASNSLEAQILKLNIDKMQLGYEQYIYQTQKSLKEQEASIKELEADAELQYVNAPYDGVVFFFDQVQEESAIDQYKPLLSIYDLNSAAIIAPVTATNNMWYNQEVSVFAINSRKEDTTKRYSGKIIADDSLLNSTASTGNFFIKIEDAPPELLVYGKSVNIYSEAIAIKNVLVIPSSAVKNDNDMKYVYILDSKNEMHKQYVTGRDNGVNMWIYSGLAEGQQIVIE